MSGAGAQRLPAVAGNSDHDGADRGGSFGRVWTGGEGSIPTLEAGEVDDAALSALRRQLGAEMTRKLLDAAADFDFANALESARALMEMLGGVQPPSAAPRAGVG